MQLADGRLRIGLGASCARQITMNRFNLGKAYALVLLLIAFSAGSLAHAQQLIFTPFHAGGIYKLGESAGWTVTLPAGVAAPASGFSYTVRKNNLDVLKTGHFDLSSGKATIEVTVDEPAMVYVEVDSDQSPNPSPREMEQLSESLKNVLVQADPANKAILDKYPSYRLLVVPVRPPGAPPANRVAALGASVAPSKLQPSVLRPADFDAFWDEHLKLLSKIPINPVLTPVANQKDSIELYTVKLDSVDSHVQGYLAKPKREGKFPALVIFQYAGVYKLQPNTATDRAAEGWLTFDVDSHDIPPAEGTGVPNGYQAIGNNDREKSYFLDMYLRDTRALDYIASRPDWDGKTIVLMGTSMGGQQSLVTAGLNPGRVTAVIVNEPSGADSNGDLHGRKAGYPNWPSTDPQVMKTALYFDTVNFASHIQAASLVAMGFIDTTAPPVGIWTALNRIPGAKEAVPMIESDHNNITPQKQGAFNDRSKEVLDILLKTGKFTPNQELTRPPQ
jgi:cephalosporin-C deacetylase